jgi:hypothetical protein
VWPDLLLLSPLGTRHQLPIRPDTGYGAWWYDARRWVEHVRAWKPTVGPILRDEHIQRVVSYLELTPVTESAAVPISVQSEDRVVDLEEGLEQMAVIEALLRQMNGRLARLETLVESLNGRVTALADGAGRGVSRTASQPLELPAAIARPLSPQERDAIVAAVNAVRVRGKSRALPSVVGELSILLNENLKETSYRGFGSAGALFRRAEQEGLIAFGALAGPNPTIWLPEEMSSVRA